MQGKFAAVMSAISILFGGILIVLSIHYFVSTIGIGTKLYKYERTCHEKLSPDIMAKIQTQEVWLMTDKGCNYLNTQLSGGSIALIIGIVQLIVSLAAIITKIVNWIIWVIAHVIGILFCLVAAALILSVYSGLNDGYNACELPSGSGVKYGITAICGFKYHIGFSMTGTVKEIEDGIISAIILYSIMILFDMIFCIIGVILMFIFRKNTLEGENGILENKVEDVVQKVSSRLLKSSKINNEADIAPQGAQAE